MHIVFLLLLSLFIARGDEGIGIDPFGRRAVRSSHALGDDGNGFDPHGAPVKAQYTGCVDPNG